MPRLSRCQRLVGIYHARGHRRHQTTGHIQETPAARKETMTPDTQPNPDLAAQMAVERIERLQKSHAEVVEALQRLLTNGGPGSLSYEQAVQQARTALNHAKTL